MTTLANLGVNLTLNTAQWSSGLKGVQSGIGGLRAQVTGIGSTVANLGRVLAGAFSVREVTRMADGYTRLQNNLRVAGVEAGKMQAVQDRLLESAQRYGVSIESLSSLFSGLTQASADLGATQSDVFKVMDAVSGSLKIMGVSASAAGGSLLQLRQLFQGSKVQAQEYNSLIDGMYPLLQAVAAGSDRWKGSVGKLTADVKASTVTTAEFFQALLRGSDQIEQRASKATMTLSGAFTVLRNRMTVLVGGAGEASGAIAGLTQAVRLLADHLNAVVTVAAGFAGLLAARYVAGLVAATAATVAASNVIFALRARMAGAATTAEVLGLAFGKLRGHLVTAAILAAAGGMYYLATRTSAARERIDELNDSSDKLEVQSAALADRLKKAGVAIDDIGSGARGAAGEVDALGRSMAEAAQRAKALEDRVGITRLRMLQAQIEEVQAERSRLKGPLGNTWRFAFQTTPEGVDAIREQNREEMAALDRREAALRQQLILTTRAMRAGVPLEEPKPAAAAPAAKPGEKKKDRKETDRFPDDLANLQIEELRARAAITDGVNLRADLEKDMLHLERDQRLAQIAATDYTVEQKKALSDIVNRLYGQAAEIGEQGEIIVHGRPGLLAVQIERERERDLLAQANELARTEYEGRRDALGIQYDLADSMSDRRRIALEILELEYRHRKTLLEEAIAAENDAEERRRLRLQLNHLTANYAGNVERTSREHMTPAQRYVESLNLSAGRLADAFDEIKIGGLEALNDGLTDAIVNFRSLGDVAQSVLRQILADLLQLQLRKAIIGPLADALGLGGSGIPFAGARAFGGSVLPNRAYLVGERGPEMFMPRGAGDIIPNDVLSGGRGGMNVTINNSFPGVTNAQEARLTASQAGIRMRNQIAAATRSGFG